MNIYPYDEWFVLLKECIIKDTIVVYVMRIDSKTSNRQVLEDIATVRTVPEGAELRALTTLSRQAAAETDVFSMFKHVYVLREVLEKYE